MHRSPNLWDNEKIFQTVWTHLKSSVCVQKSTKDNK